MRTDPVALFVVALAVALAVVGTIRLARRICAGVNLVLRVVHGERDEVGNG